MAVEESYDVVVVGSGGGLVGAYVAAARGLRTLVIEKTAVVGGTVAYSGAGLWFPGSAPLRRADVDEDPEAARTYLRTVVGDPAREHLQDAYLEAAPRLIDELERDPLFGRFHFKPVPDYFAEGPGGTAHGRTIFPQELPSSELAPERLDLVRRSIPAERRGAPTPDPLTGGRALIARALNAFLETGNGTVSVGTALTGLLVEDGRVVGVHARRDGEPVTIRAEKGVVLAAGGFERNAELRARYHALPLGSQWSNGAPENTGDALLAARAIGAATDLLDEAWFVPGLIQPDGRPTFQTATRAGIWVNAAGERFVNETRPYDQAGHELVRLHATTGVSHIPAYWILDQRALDRDGFGGDPEQPIDPSWFTSGALRRADSIEELARLIDVPLQALARTVEEFNGYAGTGVDESFHRGETAWDKMSERIVGFPAESPSNYLGKTAEGVPNQLLLPLDTPPFYVATITVSDIGTKGGLVIDEHARVLTPDGAPITGLYAAGNTAAAMSGRVYPGAGTPIGSSLTFSFLAVEDISAAS